MASATATALPGSAFTLACLKNNNNTHLLLGFGVHGLQTRRSNVKLTTALPSISAKLAPPQQQFAAAGNVLAGALFAAIASSDSALAAQQVLQLAADDNRGLAILFPLVPAVAWVLYNISQPALNQFNRMKSAKGLSVGLGIGAVAACLATAPQASAVQEIAKIADNDNRGLILLGILLPAVGWVLFNILQPALNQINRMRSAKGVAGAVGIGAAAASGLVFATRADAAVEELITIAADNNDSRGLLLLGILVPAIGWVLFNILQPALNQINRMRAQK